MNISRLTTRLGAILLCTGLLAGCATQPKPQVLQEASDRIAHSDTAELETLQPRLIREAKQFEIQARDAYERRDYDEAKLYAHLAMQRYETARNLVKRDSAQSLARNMEAADKDLAKEAQALAEERRELERYRALEDRFQGVQDELSQVREDQQGAAAQAKRLLLRARTRQAEALGAGASASAPREYAEARLLVESALEAYDTELYDESAKTSSEAIAAFDKLIESAADSARAQREREEKAAANAAKQRESKQSEKDKAQAAIDEATDAQTAAIGARMPEKQSALYQQGQFLLQTAERRLRDEDFDGAKSKALDARDIFLQGAQGTNVTTTAPNGGEAAGGAPQGASGEVRLAIQRAEDARAAALLRGGTSADLQRGDYALELARQAADRKDDPRAIAKANEATSSYDAVTGAPALGAGAAYGQLPSSGSPSPSSGGGALKKKAEEMIVELQLERAEALGQLKDQKCPGNFREFEAVLELAQQRYDAKDYAQAFEFAVRASERLQRCDASVATVSAATSSTPEPRKPTPEERAEAARRDKAADALSQAQGDYAELSVEVPEDPRLRKPAVLIASAERWFEQRDYPQAETLATRAVEDMKALRTALDKEKAVREAVASSKSSEPAEKTTSTETPEDKATDARIAEACRRVDALAEQARGEQLRASRNELDEDDQERYRRAVRALTRARALREREVCESAEILAEESLAIFEELATAKKTPEATTTKDPSKVASTKSPEKSDTNNGGGNKTDNTKSNPTVVVAAKKTENSDGGGNNRDNEAFEARATEAIAGARLARARVESQAGNNVFDTADSLLSEAERLARKGEYIKAEGLARQASGAFASLDVNATTTDAQGNSVDPTWKPAYSKVLDALILRDEVKSKVGKEERDVFERGVNNLTRSRTAWNSKDFIAAGKFADAARDDFEEALAAAQARIKREEAQAAKDKAAADKAEKDKALQEKEAKEKAEREAKEKAEREAKEKAAADKAAADKEKTAARRDAEDALRDASIKQKMCEKERCDLRDEAANIRAGETLQSAQRALDAGDFARAANLAKEAAQAYDATMQKPRDFFIPDGVTRVTRSGNQLTLSPRVKFESGGTVIVAESLRSVDELARVLKENDAIIEKVELVGYTDSRGNDAKNLALSEQRAGAVRQALSDRGVDASKLTSTGRGEENPITTNKTAAGRELNRRVEVNITLKGGKE
jgi:outer membrane protein OmpA-like peptidoglycan-associated protein